MKFVRFKAKVNQGDVLGTVANMRVRNADIQTGDETRLVGDFSIKGLPDINKTIFINGTVGMYEDTRFEIGTKNILDICSKSKAKVILGGGDALTSADHFKNNNFYFKSTGGGATL